MAFCCETTRARAREIFDEIEKRERDGLANDDRADLDVLWSDLSRLAAGFCPKHKSG